MPDGHGYNVRNQEIETLLRKLGRRIKDMMPPGWGFTLMIFNFGSPENTTGAGMFYISSAQRDDMIRAMREFITRETM